MRYINRMLFAFSSAFFLAVVILKLFSHSKSIGSDQLFMQLSDVSLAGLLFPAIAIYFVISWVSGCHFMQRDVFLIPYILMMIVIMHIPVLALFISSSIFLSALIAVLFSFVLRRKRCQG